MNNPPLLHSFSILITTIFITFVNMSLSDSENIHDICPTSSNQPIFINGFLCKNPTNITSSNFKTTLLNHVGDTENFLRSSVTLVTATEFPGLNTLGLSVARTDMAVDGIVMPHSHPRAAEIAYVSKGVVVAGFIDTKNQLFQKILKEGDVFLVPKGLLHFSFNAGYELAVVFSILNSQNPGIVSINGAMFDEELTEKLVKKLVSVSAMEAERSENVTMSGFKVLGSLFN